ncbi:MAG: peptidoglycan DD-metalloendopeptidase family protein, partial [Coxiella endosymbiont of Haemaphysalis japonica]
MRVEEMGRKSTVLIIFTGGLVLAVFVRLLCAHTSTPLKEATLSTSSPLVIVKKIKKLDLKWKTILVIRGDTLAAIFNRLKISQKDLLQLLKKNKFLAVLKPRERLSFQINSSHQLLAFQYPLSTSKKLIFIRQGNNFMQTIKSQPITTTLAYKLIIIQHSLIQDAKKSGLTSQMLSELQAIFGKKINFVYDLHRGDRFDFLYQEDCIDGKKYRNGNIVAAQFIHRGKIEQVVRYTYPINHVAYYNPNGHSVEARFLHTPVHYKRISSYFSYRRYDPVLHTVRPHLGVDFAAPLGTPIKSIGEGQIVFIGHDGGYGRTIKIRYGHHYLALYGHMLRFAKLHLHKWVYKEQIIGYVGESGWATGPHLHFGFYVNGKPRNWLAMKLPIDQTIPQKYEKPFLDTTKQLLADLHLHQDTQLAANNTKLKSP